MSETQKRRHLIREIVNRQHVTTQTQLVDMLSDRGIHSTQASVSRDMRALGLIKVGGEYALPGKTAGGIGIERGLSGRINEVRRAGDCLLVLKTDPGEASIVALALDGARLSHVSGTLAGDDTVLIACDGKAAQRQTLDLINPYVPSADLST